MLKRIAALALATLLLLGAVACGTQSTKLVKPSVVRLSGHPEYAPFMWREGDKIVGVGEELARMIFEGMGIKVESPYVGDWSAVQDKLKSGEVDCAVGMYATNERKETMDFSVSYAKDPIAIFVPKDKAFSYSKWEDLIGKKGASTKGDSFGQDFDKFIADKLNVERVDIVKNGFDKLIDGTSQYFIYALYPGEAEIKRLGIENKVVAEGTYATSENWYLSFTKDSVPAKLLPEINAKIEQYVSDGTVDRLINKYTEYYNETVLKK